MPGGGAPEPPGTFGMLGGATVAVGLTVGVAGTLVAVAGTLVGVHVSSWPKTRIGPPVTMPALPVDGNRCVLAGAAAGATDAGATAAAGAAVGLAAVVHGVCASTVRAGACPPNAKNTAAMRLSAPIAA